VLRYRTVFDGDSCVGVVGLKLMVDPEIVVSTLQAHRRQGYYATEAVKEMIRYAFEEVGLPAVHAVCLAGRPSNGATEKADFQFVVEQGGERLYKLRKDDWEAAHHAPGGAQ